MVLIKIRSRTVGTRLSLWNLFHRSQIGGTVFLRKVPTVMGSSRCRSGSHCKGTTWQFLSRMNRGINRCNQAGTRALTQPQFQNAHITKPIDMQTAIPPEVIPSRISLSIHNPTPFNQHATSSPLAPSRCLTNLHSPPRHSPRFHGHPNPELCPRLTHGLSPHARPMCTRLRAFLGP